MLITIRNPPSLLNAIEHPFLWTWYLKTFKVWAGSWALALVTHFHLCMGLVLLVSPYPDTPQRTNISPIQALFSRWFSFSHLAGYVSRRVSFSLMQFTNVWSRNVVSRWLPNAVRHRDEYRFRFRCDTKHDPNTLTLHIRIHWLLGGFSWFFTNPSEKYATVKLERMKPQGSG